MNSQPSPRRRRSRATGATATATATVSRAAAARRRINAVLEALDRRVLMTASAPGELDFSFGSGAGLALYDSADPDVFNAVTRDANGNILAVGSSGTTFGAGGAIVARFDPSGNLDTSFGVNGVATVDMSASAMESFTSVSVAPDGSIVAAGTGDATGIQSMLVAKFDQNGNLDTSFAGSGTLTAFPPGAQTNNVHIRAVSALTGGFIEITGDAIATADAKSHPFVARIASSGGYDTFFGTANGVTFLPVGGFGATVSAAIFQSDGKVLVAGEENLGPSVPALVARFNADGTADTTFGGGSGLLFDVGGTGHETFTAVTALPDGRFAVGAVDANHNPFVYHFLPDGNFDGSFGGGGIVPLPNTTASPTTLLIDPGNQVLVATDDGSVRKFSAAGALNTGWGDNGVATSDLIVTGNTLIPDGNGNVLLPGRSPGGALGSAAVAALGDPADSTAPFAFLTPAGQPTLNAPTYDFYVVYQDDQGVNPASLGAPVTVTGNPGFLQPPAAGNVTTANFLGAVVESPTSVIGRYRMTAPGGAWDAADSGTYVVAVNPGSATDFAGNPLPGSVVGQFVFNTRGAYDPSFGYTGRETVPQNAGGDLNAVSIAPDGQIIGIGNTFGSGGGDLLLEGLLPSGVVNPILTNTYHDPDFQAATGYATARTADGKLLVAGQIGDFEAVWRYNPDNSLDTSFHFGDGYATFDYGAFYDSSGVSALAFAIAVAPGSGQIYVTGLATNSVASSDAVTLARLNPDGSPDSSFGFDGMTTVNLGSPHAYGNAIGIDSGGNVVVGALADIDTATPRGVLARVTPFGALDSSFGSGGTVNLGAVQPLAVVVNPDDSTVFAGHAFTLDQAAVGRVSATGTLDGAFGGPVAGLAAATAIAAAPSGGYVVAGQSAATRQFGAARITATGAVDPAFGNGGNGVATVAFNGFSAQAHAVAIQSDGAIVLAGSSDGVQAVARLTPAGLPDPTFGLPGRAPTAAIGSGGSDAAFASAVQSDGKVLLGGSDGNDFLLYRLNPDGSLDSSFAGGNGFLEFATGFQSVFNALAVLPNGRILAAGSTFATDGVAADMIVYRFNPDGSTDTTFGNHPGYSLIDVNGDNDEARAIALTGDPANPSILLGGFAYDASGSQTDFALVRLTPAGQLDSAFGTGGRVTTDFGGANDSVASLSLTPTGQIVAFGNAFHTNSGFGVARYSATGQLDSTFGAGGTTTFSTGGFIPPILVGGTVLPNGQLLTAGYTPNEGDDLPLLVRFNADGSIDTTYGNAGSVTPVGPGFSVGAVLFDATGNTFLGGSGFQVAKVNPDGTLDFTFGTFGFTDPFLPAPVDTRSGFGSSQFAQTMTFDQTGNVVLGGSVPSVQFRSAVAAARVLVSGIPVPDLAITNVTTFPANPLQPGQALSGVGGSLVNLGAAPAPAPTVNIYLSLDTVFGNADDLLIGTVFPGAVPAHSTVPFTFPASLPAGLAAGTYHLFVAADPANLIPEADETNNVTRGPDVPVAPARPDLVAVGVSFPATAQVGSVIAPVPAISNAGTPIVGYSLAYYLSADSTFGNADDVLLGTQTAGAPPLQVPGANPPGSFTIPASLAAGNYHLVLVVDPSNAIAESSETNNVFVSPGTLAVTVPTPTPLPNLVVTGVSYDTTVTQGAVFTITPTLKDAGNANAPATPVNFVLSTDSIFGNADDVLLGSAPLGSLTAGQSASANPVSFPIPRSLPAGTYFLFAVADPGNTVSESVETDNVLLATPITINAAPTPPVARPDLYIASLDFAPGSYMAGSSPFTYVPVIGNAGTAASPGTTLQLRLSTDAIFGNADDVILSSLDVPAIAAGATTTLSPVTMTLPGNLPAGNFFVFAGVDPSARVSELAEDNNLFLSPTASITILPATPRSNTTGTLDPNFGNGGIATTTFTTIFTTVDSRSDTLGRFVATGYTNTGDLFLTRFNADGSLDVSFGTNGRTVTDVRGTTDVAAAITIDPLTGKIYVAGYTANPSDPNDNDFLLVRYDTDGTVDTTFAQNGFSVTDLGALAGAPNSDDRATAVSLLITSGQFYVAGSMTAAGGNSDFAILRLNADGSPDATFNHTGLATVDFGGQSDVANAIALQRDTKIILAGSTDTGAGVTQIAAARLNTDGSLDTSFSKNGRFTTTLRNVDDEAFAATVQSDGRIVLGGLSAQGSLTDGTRTSDFALVRLTAGGSLDNSFAHSGSVITSIPGSQLSGINKAIVQYPGGKILVAGKTAATLNDALAGNLGAVLARYNLDGSLDTNFNRTGILQLFTPTPVAPSAPAAPGDSLTSQFDAFAANSQGLVDLTPGGGILALASANDPADASTTVQLAAVTSDGVDLTPALTTKGVKSSMLAGAKGTATITITNAGTANAKGTIQVKLYLSTDQTLSTDDTAFVTANLSLNLKPKQKKAFKVNFVIPADLADGTYFLLTNINTNAADGLDEINDTNNVAAAPATTTVSAPDAHPTPAFTGQLPPAFTPARKQSVTVQVRNAGTATAKGPATLSLFASPDQTLDANDLLLGTLTKSLNLKPNQSILLTLSFTLAAGALPPGTDFLAATLQFAGDTLTAFSATPVTAP